MSNIVKIYRYKYFRNIKVGDKIRILDSNGYHHVTIKTKLYKIIKVEDCRKDDFYTNKICNDCISDGYCFHFKNDFKSDICSCNMIMANFKGEKFI